jgi:hypothetical protein
MHNGTAKQLCLVCVTSVIKAYNSRKRTKKSGQGLLTEEHLSLSFMTDWMIASETLLMAVSSFESDHLDSRSRRGENVAKARIVVTSRLPIRSIPAPMVAQIKDLCKYRWPCYEHKQFYRSWTRSCANSTHASSSLHLAPCSAIWHCPAKFDVVGSVARQLDHTCVSLLETC